MRYHNGQRGRSRTFYRLPTVLSNSLRERQHLAVAIGNRRPPPPPSGLGLIGSLPLIVGKPSNWLVKA